MKKILKNSMLFVLIAVLVFSFSGCSIFDFFAADSLMKPPKLTGEKAELQKAFEQTVGSDISLFTPIAGDYRGSYIIFDLNSDGNDEAVVFYSLNSNSSVVQMHLLTHRESGWVSVGDITGSGTDVYKVDFQDVGINKNLEINVVWTLDDSKKEKTLCIYRVASLESNYSDAIVSLASIQISDYAFCDVDSDSTQELLYFYSVASNNSAAARLIDYNSQENIFVPISEVSLNFTFSQILNVSYDIEDSDVRFYIDCISNNDELFSQIIVYSHEAAALFIPTFDGVALSEKTTRSSDIFCTDFNGDGYLDIPVNLDVAGDKENDEAASPVNVCLVQWYTLFDNSFTSIGKYFISIYDGYAVKIDELADKFVFNYDSINKVTHVSVRNSDDENDIVFSVSRNTGEDVIGILPDGFLTDKKESDYNVVISSKGESYGFTESYILSLISEL